MAEFWTSYGLPFALIVAQSAALLVILLVIVAFLLYADRKVWAVEVAGWPRREFDNLRDASLAASNLSIAGYRVRRFALLLGHRQERHVVRPGADERGVDLVQVREERHQPLLRRAGRLTEIDQRVMEPRTGQRGPGLVALEFVQEARLAVQVHTQALPRGLAFGLFGEPGV